METVSHGKGNYILRFDKGERYPAAFADFLQKKKISGGFFYGLGACTDPEVSFYDLKRKKYLTRRFKGDFEVLNVSGNIAKTGKELVMHQHITLGGKDYAAFGGHLVNMLVGGTLEIFLTPAAAMRRSKDNATGLNLLDV